MEDDETIRVVLGGLATADTELAYYLALALWFMAYGIRVPATDVIVGAGIDTVLSLDADLRIVETEEATETAVELIAPDDIADTLQPVLGCPLRTEIGINVFVKTWDDWTHVI